jgi:hypothetical protein
MEQPMSWSFMPVQLLVCSQGCHMLHFYGLEYVIDRLIELDF